jgi:hypothetical protein
MAKLSQVIRANNSEIRRRLVLRLVRRLNDRSAYRWRTRMVDGHRHLESNRRVYPHPGWAFEAVVDDGFQITAFAEDMNIGGLGEVVL